MNIAKQRHEGAQTPHTMRLVSTLWIVHHVVGIEPRIFGWRCSLLALPWEFELADAYSGCAHWVTSPKVIWEMTFQ